MSSRASHWDRVPVTIGGRELYIRFSLAATTRLQATLGVKSLRDVIAIIDQLNPKAPEPEAADQSTAPDAPPTLAAGATDWVLDVDLDLLGNVLWAGLLECLGAEAGRATTKDDIMRDIRLAEVPAVLAQIVLAIALQFAPPPAQPDNPDPLAGGQAAPITMPPSTSPLG